MRRPFLNRPVGVIGQSMPMAALILLGIVILGSAIASFATRMGVPVLPLSVLTPSMVMKGQVWRALTWAFLETNGQNLVFGAAMLFIFGRELAGLWGGTRYLTVAAGIAFSSGVATTIVGLLWRDVYQGQYISIWPLADALVVAWSMIFPTRNILFMFVLPITGRSLLYVTVGITTLFAIMYDFSMFVPHFLAMGLMYVYIRGGSLIATEMRLKSLFSRKRDKRGLKVVDGGWNSSAGKGPNGSGWVH